MTRDQQEKKRMAPHNPAPLSLNQKGFTLVELLSVLVILGVLAALSISRVENLSHAAIQSALLWGQRELNVRETLAWTEIKLSDTGWISDEEVFATLDTKLGNEYSWNPGPDIKGGTLHFKYASTALARIPSTIRSSGNWH